MTLEQVMALDGTALNEAVAVKIGRCPHPSESLTKWSVSDGDSYDWGFSCGRCGKGDIYGDSCPDFSRDWSAAMQIRDWVKSGDNYRMYTWAIALAECVDARLENTRRERQYLDVILHATPADYCRAALLVSVGE